MNYLQPELLNFLFRTYALDRCQGCTPGKQAPAHDISKLESFVKGEVGSIIKHFKGKIQNIQAYHVA